MWPDVSYASDGETILIRSRMTPRYNAPVQYLETFKAEVSASAFEEAVDGFVGSVVERLEVLGIKSSDADGLRGLWEGICSSRNDPDQAYWRKMEAMLGYDLDDAPEELLEKLHVLKSSCGEMAVEEMMAAADDITRGAIERLPEEIERIRGEVRSRALDITIPKVGEIREQMEASDACRQSKHYKSPRQRAVEVAAIVRTAWGLDRGPLPSEVLHGRLGISLQVLDQGGGENAAGVSAGFRGGSGNDLSVSLHENCRRDRRFLLARLIGDHIDFAESNEGFYLPPAPGLLGRNFSVPSRRSCSVLLRTCRDFSILVSQSQER